MNDLIKWLEDDHEDVEVLVYDSGDSIGVQLTDRTTSFKIKQHLPKSMLRMHNIGPDEFALILDDLYFNVKSMHKVGIMMEE